MTSMKGRVLSRRPSMGLRGLMRWRNTLGGCIRGRLISRIIVSPIGITCEQPMTQRRRNCRRSSRACWRQSKIGRVSKMAFRHDSSGDAPPQLAGDASRI